MRILIVGAGIGGMTLAALLERRGVVPSIVERAESFEHAGYVLSLYPLGSRVLHGVGLYERFVETGVEATGYAVHDDRGRLVKRWAFGPIVDRFGPIVSTTRPQLVKLLHGALHETDVRFGVSLEDLKPMGQEVRATFSDGSEGTFDLVVGADGMNSRVRKLMFGDQPRFETGWGGWVWWSDLSPQPETEFVEYWGTGRFLGLYPTCDGAGVFAGAPVSSDVGQPGAGRQQRLQQRFFGMGGQADAILDGIPGDDAEMFYWRLSDVQSSEWLRGRVVLLGDAAAGFLPTAGLGASMAMESAAVLNDELSRTDNPFLEQSLANYVRRRRRRVERMQQDSRKMGRMMFLTSAPLATARNFAMQFYSLKTLARGIAQAFEEPI